MIVQLARISLKNKIFFSILGVILLVSLTIAIVSRWIIVSNLTRETRLRGQAIARSIAERGAGDILDRDMPGLLTLIYDEANLRERTHLIAYIYVLDRDGRMLAHTFVRRPPDDLAGTNPVAPGEHSSMRELVVHGRDVLDIAVPVTEGLYQIGSVHVGLARSHLEGLIAKLRVTFVGFISVVVLMLFLLSNILARYITRPLRRLTGLADEISHGNFDVSPDLGGGTPHRSVDRCPAFVNTDLFCPHIEPDKAGAMDELPEACRECGFFTVRQGDEVVQLAESFRNMVWSIRLYRRRLRDSEEKYRSLFDSGPDPVMVLDRGSREILDANPRACELFDYPRQDLVGMPYGMLGPDHADELLAPFADDTLTECVYRTKLVHFARGEYPLYLNVHACPVRYKGHRAIIMGLTDITEMMEKDAQLIQASKMKSLGEMSAGVAHELTQPLNAIRLGAEYLSLLAEQGKAAQPDQLRDVAWEVSTQVDRAADIITTLRTFGRKADPVSTPVNLNTCVQGVLSIVRRQMELDNIEFSSDPDPDIPPVQAQDNRVQQVLFNLITNARDAILDKAASSDGPVERTIAIATGHGGGWAWVTVRDSGPGIPEAVRDKIFEPFFTTKKAGQGMGLGLAICYEIVRDYGGEFQITSTPGQGTTFVLRFPIPAEHGTGEA